MLVDCEQTMTSEARHGGVDRLRRVFAARSDALYRFIIVRVGGDRAVADDLLQQACYVAVRRSGKVPPDDDTCEAWLRGIARNLIRQYWRKCNGRAKLIRLEDVEQSRRLLEKLESGALPEESLARDESVQQLLLAVTSLPADQQRLVFAFYFEECSYAAIADELGITAKGVETRLYRARARLREVLAGVERSGE
jgi:RNA polymerase sigma-70 factor (ECF subfamily)